MKQFINVFLLKGLSVKHKLIVWWFVLSFVLIGCTVDAPAWFYLLELASLFVSGRLLKDVPLPDYFEEEHE